MIQHREEVKFSGTKAQGNGVCCCHLWAGLQLMLRNCTSCCPDHVKRVLMTKDGAVSTEGKTQPQGWPGKLDCCFLWSRFHRTPQTELLIFWPKKDFENSSLWEVGNDMLTMFQWARTQNWINSYSKVWWQGRSKR